MKKMIVLSVAIVMLLTSCKKADIAINGKTSEATLCTEVTVKPTEIEVTTERTETTVNLKERVKQEIPINFKNALLYCVETNEILYDYNSNEKVAPASIQKLLTAIVAFENATSSTIFEVGSELELLNAQSSLCLISKGQKLSLYDLVTGLLLASGNDAAYTIAVNVARRATPNEAITDLEAVDIFCKMMNDCANKIGMKNSNFTNPDGWDDENNYSTCYDLMLLTKYALSVQEIEEIVSLSQKYVVFASGQNITWKNTNKLLDVNGEYYISSAIGVKTGSTEAAMNCLSAAFKINHKTYIAIIMGCESDDERYITAQNLYMIATVSRFEKYESLGKDYYGTTEKYQHH